MAGQDLSALLSVDLDALDDAALVQHATALETASRLVEAAQLRVDAQLTVRGVGPDRGYKTTAAFLRDLHRISPAAARGRTRAAEAVGPRRALTGEPLEPIYPTVAAAQAAGEIAAAHARVVARTVESLPAEVRAQHDRSVEALLVDKAKQFDPDTLSRVVARRVLDTLDPDGTLQTVEERHTRRGHDIHVRPDGSSHVEGDLTAECTELLLTLRDSLGRPASTSDAPDTRTHRQRCHDALLTGLARLVRSEWLPDIAGVKATIVLTMSAEDYAAGTGYATTGHGRRIPVQEAKRWATADHDLIAVLLNRTKRIEAYSDRHRIFNRNQRLALWARDRGCTFPGCSAPPGWTEVHHVIEAQAGGPTSTDNGVLLCDWHHDHHSRIGWRCEFRDGTPYWIPPSWLDSEQRPRRNELNL